MPNWLQKVSNKINQNLIRKLIDEMLALQ